MSRFTWRQGYIFSGYSVCWPCMCGVMFCRYTCWSRDHHVRAEYQLPLWSENGTTRLYCSASTILKSLDICYIHIFYNFFFEKLLLVYLFNVIFTLIYILSNHVFPIFFFLALLFKPTFRMLFVGVQSSNTHKANRGLFLINWVLNKVQFSHELFKSRRKNHGQHKTRFHQYLAPFTFLCLEIRNLSSSFLKATFSSSVEWKLTPILWIRFYSCLYSLSRMMWPY